MLVINILLVRIVKFTTSFIFSSKLIKPNISWKIWPHTLSSPPFQLYYIFLSINIW